MRLEARVPVGKRMAPIAAGAVLALNSLLRRGDGCSDFVGMDLTLLFFIVVYLAMALGRLPGFRVDRTGAALLGAIAMLATDQIGSNEAWNSVDHSTLGLLFGLMIISGHFTAAGFYAWVTERTATLPVGPRVLLGTIIAVSALLSAVLTNNVVAVAMAPLLVDLCAARRLNPVPYLLALACASNVGSAATIIGSAQNVIIAQRMNLSFAGFTADTGLPALLSLPVVWMVIAWAYRNRWKAKGSGQAIVSSTTTALDLWETIKGLIVIIGVLIAFIATDWSRSYVALVGAAVLLLNRRISSKEVLHNVDGNLLLMLFGLFVVNQAFADLHLVPGWIADLRELGIDLHSPGWLYLITMAVSDVIGNTPAAMLLAPYAEGSLAGASMALASALSSNLVVFGSLAGIIVVNAAAARDIPVSFGEFSRVGVPITVLTMIIGYGWLLLRMAA